MSTPCPTPRHSSRRRGMAALLAMLYLILFSALALGFYAQTTAFAQVSQSELRILRARTAAESGLMVLRYHVGQLKALKENESHARLAEIAGQLATRLNGTANLAGHPLEHATDADGTSIIYIPGRSGGGSPNWIDLGDVAGRFRAVLRIDAGGNLIVRSYGQDSAGASPITRAVECGFAGSRSTWLSPGKGVLSRSPVHATNGARIQGGNVTVITSRLTPSVDLSGGARISGNVTYGPDAQPPRTSNGARILGAVSQLEEAPLFPEIDGSNFESFVPPRTAPAGPRVLDQSSNIPSNAVLTNIRIKANSNLTLGNSVQLNGVIYIESPNQITFGGGGRINGVIVTDNNHATPLAGNQITIANGIKMEGVESLEPALFEPADRIDELVKLTGTLVLAPNFKVILAGGTKSYSGAWVASEFDISNGYKGTITGMMINLADTSFNMMGGGQLDFAAGPKTLAGLYGASRLKIDTDSYREVMP